MVLYVCPDCGKKILIGPDEAKRTRSRRVYEHMKMHVKEVLHEQPGNPGPTEVDNAN